MKKIITNNWYRPSEIAQNGWIKNSKGKGDYMLVLKLIRKGRLKARNFGLGLTPYYRILGSEIIRYLNSLK